MFLMFRRREGSSLDLILLLWNSWKHEKRTTAQRAVATKYHHHEFSGWQPIRSALPRVLCGFLLQKCRFRKRTFSPFASDLSISPPFSPLFSFVDSWLRGRATTIPKRGRKGEWIGASAAATKRKKEEEEEGPFSIEIWPKWRRMRIHP